MGQMCIVQQAVLWVYSKKKRKTVQPYCLLSAYCLAISTINRIDFINCIFKIQYMAIGISTILLHGASNWTIYCIHRPFSAISFNFNKFFNLNPGRHFILNNSIQSNSIGRMNAIDLCIHFSSNSKCEISQSFFFVWWNWNHSLFYSGTRNKLVVGQKLQFQ